MRCQGAALTGSIAFLVMLLTGLGAVSPAETRGSDYATPMRAASHFGVALGSRSSVGYGIHLGWGGYSDHGSLRFYFGTGHGRHRHGHHRYRRYDRYGAYAYWPFRYRRYYRPYGARRHGYRYYNYRDSVWSKEQRRDGFREVLGPKVAEALRFNRNGESSTWVDPDTGTQTTVTPTRTYRGDAYCREYSLEVLQAGRREAANGKACRKLNGTWELVK